MPKDKKEYHRIKYSLKMALRIINGTFDDFNVQQYGTSGFNFEDDNEMTTVECWYKPEPNEKEKIERDLNLPFEKGVQSVRTGAILRNSSEIKFGETVDSVFYVFRVVVGRSCVMKSTDTDVINKNDLKEKLIGTIYDSIYIDEGKDSSNDFVSHLYYVFDPPQCRLLYKVTCKVCILPPLENFDIKKCSYGSCPGGAGKTPATVYCVNDKSYFCSDCDTLFHQHPQFLADHVRIDAKNKKQKFKDFGQCLNHKKRFEFFNTETC